MRILDWKRLREKVPLSRMHVGRLEAAGKFPKRVRYSQNRVGWIEEEIDDWIAERINQRESTDTSR